MAFKYRSKKTGREVEFTRAQADLEKSDDWTTIETGDGLPARAPNPGVLAALSVVSDEDEAAAKNPTTGYAAGAAVDLGTTESPGVDVDDPDKADAGTTPTTTTSETVEVTAPVKSATRKEWDAFATSRGLTPADFKTKDDLMAAVGKLKS